VLRQLTQPRVVERGGVVWDVCSGLDRHVGSLPTAYCFDEHPLAWECVICGKLFAISIDEAEHAPTYWKCMAGGRSVLVSEALSIRVWQHYTSCGF
jgi:hypothetical protein